MSARVAARTAGALYLLVIIAGLFAEMIVRSTLIVRTDAAATMANIIASEQLFRFGAVADLVAAVSYLAVTFLLFLLLRRVNEALALLSLVLGTAGSIIMAANLVNLFAPLTALRLGGDISGPLQLQALVSLRLHGVGYGLSIIFFGAHLLTLGALILRSGFMPRLLGYLLVIAGPSWLIYTLTQFLAPAVAAYMFPFVPLLSLIAEGALALWLLLARLPRNWVEKGPAPIAHAV